MPPAKKLRIATIQRGRAEFAVPKQQLRAAFQLTFGRHFLVTRISIVEGDAGQRYLVARGRGHEKDGSIVTRFPLGKRGSTLTLDMKGRGESCSGNPCRHCAFAKGGGCKCKSSSSFGICNHTISRLTNFKFLVS